MSAVRELDRWRVRKERLGAVVLASDPYCDPDEGESVEFRLTYEGLLLGRSQTNPRARHKHEIRKVFHPQLRKIWDAFPALDNTAVISERRRDVLAENFTRSGYKFVPLVTHELSLLCSISILFLRPDIPGEVLSSGDLDNRIKTLFDGLRMPKDKPELGGFDVPAEDETPFYCLLEDDALISHLSVEADMLLEPTSNPPDRNDARLVITVKKRPYRVSWENLDFA